MGVHYSFDLIWGFFLLGI